MNDLPLLRQTAEEVGLGSARHFLWPLLCRVDSANLFALPRDQGPHLLADQVDKDVQAKALL